MDLPLPADAGLPLAAFGLLLGMGFGAIAQHGFFCTMGAVSDIVLFGSLRRARVWGLAVGSAILVTQALAWAGVIDLGGTIYLRPSIFWLGAVLGGVMLGLGMVQAGGCPGRNLVRLGTGSLKALVVVLIVGVCALLITSGPLSFIERGLMQVGSVEVAAPTQGLDALLHLLGLPPGTARPLAALALALPPLLLGLGGERRERQDLLTGLGIGLLIPLGWLGTSLIVPAQPASLAFVEPVGRSLAWLMGTGGILPGFPAAAVLGVPLGAALVTWARRQLRLEAFAARDDMVRHCRGAALMGFGGALSFGCTVGEGLTGLSALSLDALIAVLAMVLGAAWGVKQLETGRFLPWPRPRQAVPAE